MCTLLCVYNDCQGFDTSSPCFFFIFSCTVFSFGLVMQVGAVFFMFSVIILYPIGLVLFYYRYKFAVMKLTSVQI